MTRGLVSRTYAPTVASSGRGRTSRGIVDWSIGCANLPAADRDHPTTIVPIMPAAAWPSNEHLNVYVVPASSVTVPVASGCRRHLDLELQRPGS